MTLQGHLQRQATDQAAVLNTLRVRGRLINVIVCISYFANSRVCLSPPKNQGAHIHTSNQGSLPLYKKEIQTISNLQFTKFSSDK